MKEIKSTARDIEKPMFKQSVDALKFISESPWYRGDIDDVDLDEVARDHKQERA